MEFRRLVDRPLPVIVTGLGLQLFGAIIGGASWWGRNDLGARYHNLGGAIVGLTMVWIGFLLLLTGLIALATQYVVTYDATTSTAPELQTEPDPVA